MEENFQPSISYASFSLEQNLSITSFTCDFRVMVLETGKMY